MNFKIEKALSKVRQKKYAEAQKIYQRILKQNPKDLDANYLLGTLFAERRMYDDSRFYLKRALELNPESEKTLTNIAGLYKLEGKLELAEEYFRRALVINQSMAEANFGLGSVLDMRGCAPNIILQYYQAAIASAPNLAEGYQCIGALLSNDNNEEAIQYFETALSINSNLKGIYKDIGGFYLKQGDQQKAIDNFLIAKQRSVQDIETDYFLCIARNEEPDEKLKSQYIQNEFDNFAKNFDHKLVDQLGYQIPGIGYKYLEEHLGQNMSFECIADLGCGTGLNGPLYESRAVQIIGIDISDKMLKEAKERGCYSKLLAGEICEVLDDNKFRLDLFIGMDLVVYIGDLEPMFKAVINSSMPGGYLMFSTELYEGDGYILQKTGRYAHSEEYVRKLSASYDCTVVGSKRSLIRKENEEDINGDVFLIKLPEVIST